MVKVAFLGAGRMASAIINSLLTSKLYRPNELICTSAEDGTGESLSAQSGILYTDNLETLFTEAETLVLAFKPQQLRDISSVHASLSAGKLIISILAGITIEKLENKFTQTNRIVRSMPNTPGQIGAGITCFASREKINDDDMAIVERILGALGPAILVSEECMDAVTAVSGSGPAYLFEFVAALRDGGVKAGLDADLAYKLALETALGASRLLARTNESPEILRDLVSSPGGTTLAGLEVMKNRNFREIMADTVLAAKKRSIELAKE